MEWRAENILVLQPECQQQPKDSSGKGEEGEKGKVLGQFKEVFEMCTIVSSTTKRWAILLRASSNGG
jgi:hypothetical protein